MVKVGLEVSLYAYGPVEGVPPGVTVRDAELVLPFDTMRRVRESIRSGTFQAFRKEFLFKLSENEADGV